jgi:hypothetical protein
MDSNASVTAQLAQMTSLELAEGIHASTDVDMDVGMMDAPKAEADDEVWQREYATAWGDRKRSLRNPECPCGDSKEYSQLEEKLGGDTFPYPCDRYKHLRMVDVRGTRQDDYANLLACHKQLEPESGSNRGLTTEEAPTACHQCPSDRSEVYRQLLYKLRYSCFQSPCKANEEGLYRYIYPQDMNDYDELLKLHQELKESQSQLEPEPECKTDLANAAKAPPSASRNESQEEAQRRPLYRFDDKTPKEEQQKRLYDELMERTKGSFLPTSHHPEYAFRIFCEHDKAIWDLRLLEEEMGRCRICEREHVRERLPEEKEARRQEWPGKRRRDDDDDDDDNLVRNWGKKCRRLP